MYIAQKRTKKVYHGCETLSSLVPKIWQLISNSLKNETALAVFKNKIMTWATKITTNIHVDSARNIQKEESDSFKIFQR